MPEETIILPGGVTKKLSEASRDDVLRALEYQQAYRDEWIRRQVINNNRIDILSNEILGRELQPFHLNMLQFQIKHPESLQLAFRGSGKTSSCTITKIIHLLVKNRDIRICLISKTKGVAESILKEIKGHLETNEELIRIFGEFYDPHRVAKWDNSEIEVVGRSKVIREGSVTCVGIESQIVSKHYDVLVLDDVIDEENARTKHLRDKTRMWYYTTLMPTLEPPDKNFVHRGEQHILGTRYHYDDLYGHLIANEFREHTNIIPALDENDRSPWPEKYPSDWLKERRVKSGMIVFESQYQCRTDAMKGEVFRYDDCQQVHPDDFPDPKDMKIFTGVDLAISQRETADQFAIVTIGVYGDISADDYKVYVLDFYAGQLRFSEQTDKIVEFYEKWDPILCLIEANAYQLAQIQQLQDKHPGLRVQPHITDKDKTTRAWKLSPIFEQGRVFFKRGVQGPIIDQLVLFPNHRYKDLFDALDLSVTAIKVKKRRKKRRERVEPGIISIGGGK